MIKSLYLIAFLTVLTSCSKSNKKYYSGYIYNKNKPIKKAKIIDASNCTHFTFTDEKGYFALKKLEKSIDEIIIIQNKSEVDTINLLSGGGLKKPYIFFLREGIIDTLYLDKERIFKNQTKY